MNNSHSRSRGRRLGVGAVVVSIALGVAAAALFWRLQTTETVAAARWDDDLCPLPSDDVAGSATYLLDLRKPVGDAGAPGRLVRDVLGELGAGDELRVFALTGDPAAPRQSLGRLCKPYAEADLTVQGAKGQGQRDCDNLPVQITERLSTAARRFCERRKALEARIEALAQGREGAIADSYLIEALEETAQALAQRPEPRRLYVYSDMIQHAPWYSHLDIAWPRWSYEVFASLRGGEAPSVGGAAASSVSPARVTVFYPLRRKLTEPLRPRYAHQTFWRAYFRETQGAQVAFRELPATPGYAAARLMPPDSVDVEHDVEQTIRQAQQTLAKSRQQQGEAASNAEPAAATPP